MKKTQLIFSPHLPPIKDRKNYPSKLLESVRQVAIIRNALMEEYAIRAGTTVNYFSDGQTVRKAEAFNEGVEELVLQINESINNFSKKGHEDMLRSTILDNIQPLQLGNEAALDESFGTIRMGTRVAVRGGSLLFKETEAGYKRGRTNLEREEIIINNFKQQEGESNILYMGSNHKNMAKDRELVSTLRKQAELQTILIESEKQEIGIAAIIPTTDEDWFIDTIKKYIPQISQKIILNLQTYVEKR